MELLPKVIAHPMSCIVRVFSCSQIETEYPKLPYAYEYTMERLLPITQAEKDIIHVFSQADEMFEGDSDYVRRFNKEQSDTIYKNAEKTHPGLYRFLCELGHEYSDLHDDQIMKTRNGQYKAVDLEAFISIDIDGSNILPSLLSKKNCDDQARG